MSNAGVHGAPALDGALDVASRFTVWRRTPLQRRADAADQRAELATRWAIWRDEKRRRLGESRGQGIAAAAVFEFLTRLCPADAIIAVDVGNNTYCFGRYFESQGQRVLMSGYLGSIGFALPAALGAWAPTQDFDALPGRKVVRSPAMAVSASTRWSSPPPSSTAWTSPICC